MCELFGVSSAKPMKINKYLEVFVAHSCDNPHGWGFASFNGRKVHLVKEAANASLSPHVKDLLEREVMATNYFAHIRMGTRGQMSYRNCHPFSGKDRLGRDWTLQHNGTIFHDELLQKYVPEQKGQTDSERIFLYLLDKVNSAEERLGRDLTKQERCALVDEMVLELVPGNKVNLMIYDGELMYVHSNFRNTLYVKKLEDARIFATVPLDDEKWELLPFMQLRVYEDGQEVFQGTKHNHEYIFDPSHYIEKIGQ